jgi:hypothetical protein
LAEDDELLTLLADAISRGIAAKTFAIDFKKFIETWKRQKELEQSGLLPPPQQAAISEQ